MNEACLQIRYDTAKSLKLAPQAVKSTSDLAVCFKAIDIVRYANASSFDVGSPLAIVLHMLCSHDKVQCT
jgi:hypothetical protein